MENVQKLYMKIVKNKLEYLSGRTKTVKMIEAILFTPFLSYP